MRKILTISLTLLLIGGILFLVGFMDSIHKDVVCNSLEITISNPLEDQMISRNEVHQIVDILEPSLIGMHIGEIDIDKIEKAIVRKPYVKEANVWSTVNGSIYINVTQREPLMRIINSKNEQFYIDRQGVIIPWDLTCPARVIVASGAIDESFNLSRGKVINIKSLPKKSILRELFYITSKIDEDEFTRAMIGQIYVQPDSEYQLLPLIGKQEILMGDTSNLDIKLENLKAFYKQVMSKYGWNTYHTINIKFDNQVVCTK